MLIIIYIKTSLHLNNCYKAFPVVQFLMVTTVDHSKPYPYNVCWYSSLQSSLGEYDMLMMHENIERQSKNCYPRI